LPEEPLTPSIRRERSGRWTDLFPLVDWFRHRSFRSWPVFLFLLLICVPSIALVLLGANPTPGTFDVAAWIFAAYFALAWLLLLGVIIRPDHVTRPMLIAVALIALVTEVPLALTLEEALKSNNASLGASIFTIGLPEELAKALPIVVIALIYRRTHHLMPRDYLFLGAVSGLVFGASEVVRYFTVNAIAQFYLTVKAAIPSIEHLIKAGNSAPTSVFEVLTGPVLYFIIEFVWRFLTDPITHACWSGLTGYFIGLAVTSRYHWYEVGWIGLAMAAVLHGLNDWGSVNSHPVWILVVLASGILFLGYARVGARDDVQFPEVLRRASTTQHTTARPALGAAAGKPIGAPVDGPLAVPAGHHRGTVAKGGNRRPWWEH
jgi:RsiW-degrading membrane proteinase PrsW (M82 family)